MATILLAGDDAALLEGLAQMLASLGHAPTVVRTLGEARDVATHLSPLVAVLEHSAIDGMESLGIALAAGGATVLYRAAGTAAAVLPPAIRRSVIAELTLPLERNRLLALVQRVEERATVVGRGARNTPPETPALK